MSLGPVYGSHPERSTVLRKHDRRDAAVGGSVRDGGVIHIYVQVARVWRGVHWTATFVTLAPEMVPLPFAVTGGSIAVEIDVPPLVPLTVTE